MSHCHECSRSQCLLVFSYLKISKLTFSLRPLPAQTGLLLSLDPLVSVDWWELWLLPWSELLPLRRGRSTRSVSRKLWSALSSMMSSPPTNILRTMYFPWLSSAIPCSSIPQQLHLRIIFFYTLHPLFNVACCQQGSSQSSFSLRDVLVLRHLSSFPPLHLQCLSDPICTTLTVILTWACLPAQITGACTLLNATSLAFLWGMPLFERSSPQRIRLLSPGARTTASGNSFFYTFLEYICNQQASPNMGGWRLITSSLPLKPL